MRPSIIHTNYKNHNIMNTQRIKNNCFSKLKLLFISVICAVSTHVLAHHSFVSHYDPARSITLTGVVSKFTFRNPHSFVFIDVEGETGETKSWEVELHSKAVLSRMGLNQTNLKAGDTISVTAWPNREQGNPLVFGIGLIITEGTKIGEHPKLVAKDSVYLSKEGVGRIQGRWKSPLVRPETRTTLLQLNETGAGAVENFTPENSPANTCEIVNLPTAYHVPYLYDIALDSDVLEISYEIYGIKRRIPIGETFEQTEDTGMLGASRAKIEGDYLIIESKDFPESGWGLAQAGDYVGRGVDVPSSTAKTLIEKISVSEDGLTLNIDYELNDSAYLSETFVNRVNGLRVSDDETIYPYECDIESAVRYTQ